MKTEDDTFDKLRRRSFEEVVRWMSNNHDVDYHDMYDDVIRIIGKETSRPSKNWQRLYPDWPFDEFKNECRKRNIYK